MLKIGACFREEGMADVFIIYASEERILAARLAAELDRNGYSLWWDVALLPPGSDYRGDIDNELNRARAAIVIWTPNSVRSHGVLRQADMAHRRGNLISTRVEELAPRDIPLPPSIGCMQSSFQTVASF